MMLRIGYWPRFLVQLSAVPVGGWRSAELDLQHIRSTRHRSQHFRSTSWAPPASRNVGVYWWVISYNIYRIIKLLARYTQNNSKNMRFAARSQHSSSERSTFAAPRVVLVKIHGCEINKYIIIWLSVKSQRLTPNIRGDILILRIGFFYTKKIQFSEWTEPAL